MTRGSAPEPLATVATLERWADSGPERDGLIGLDRNERLAPLPDAFLAALRERLTSSLASIYPTTTTLRSELAATLDVPLDTTFITPGTDAALRSVHLAFVRPGDAVVHLEPTYAMVPVYARMFGAEAVAVPFDESLHVDADALVAAVRPGVRLVLIANPNQPTGTLLPAGVLQRLVESSEAAGALLVVDEAYEAFAGETALAFALESENVLVLRSFSKAAGLAGLRIGFAVGAPAIIRALSNVRAAGEVNTVGIEAARLVLSHPDVVADYVELVAGGRLVLEARMSALGVDALPSRTNFVNLRLPEGRDPGAIAALLRERGFIVRGPFAPACLAGCIRVTLGPPELMGTFADALAASLEVGS